MEKRRPTYDLAHIQRAIGTADTLAITGSAIRDAYRMGFDRAGVADVICSTTRVMFYKSMSTYDDHRAWQDVYHVPHADGVIYLKFQDDVLTEFKVVSFKEK